MATDPDDYEDFMAEERNCQSCHGEGWEECQDSNTAEGCWIKDCDGDTHTCGNCRGSGLAKDQWYW
jgi:hypothetical protein